ncbi:WD domain, G-beta repeat-containing protein [Toxoplasma gondii GAB2-2007-GAL-DOM2]|uniref:WD domain, G-beta repeat-containing protein n=3 Tax=Toxoplasma gondii TaxID=5811 RepID=V4YYH6_TOXGV|nr:WD domain, G-beta repeat-containing protein [Toxoplasma gondii VEG]KFG27612.1 WD domain, G-beta repeat-containing protein [Toxoplasma gondii p89]KFG38134.1 WD domain, G-beta repeat-containing protein [Toxoplasma gondii GAB2-2007-GAL-DOM2]
MSEGKSCESDSQTSFYRGHKHVLCCKGRVSVRRQIKSDYHVSRYEFRWAVFGCIRARTADGCCHARSFGLLLYSRTPGRDRIYSAVVSWASCERFPQGWFVKPSIAGGSDERKALGRVLHQAIQRQASLACSGDENVCLGCPFIVDLAAASRRCSNLDLTSLVGSAVCVSAVPRQLVATAWSHSSSENAFGIPQFSCDCFRELHLLQESTPQGEVTVSHRSSSERVLDNALRCMGVPSGGKCWRGKYLLKHSLERKFASAQFDLQRTWFLDSPTLGPPLPGSEGDALEDTRGLRSASSGTMLLLDGTPPSSDGGNCSHDGDDETNSPLVYSSMFHRHCHHPRYLCHSRDRHSNRKSDSWTPTIRPLIITSTASRSRLSPASTSGGPPPVCVVSLRFFGDGAGLLYAARAGGVGAFCPDRGCHLRIFSLHRRVRRGEARRVRPAESHASVGDRQAMRRGRTRWGANGSLRQTGEESRFHSASSEGSGRDSESQSSSDQVDTDPDNGGSDAVVGEEHRSRREARGLERPAFALCVAHTIDDAMGRLHGYRNSARSCRTQIQLEPTANFERQRPLVIGGYSDGKIRVWDYCHPGRVLEHLDVNERLHRGPFAIKSVCAISGGRAGRGGCDILAGAEDGAIALLSADRPDIGIVQRLRGHTAAIQSIACERESSLVFSASRDRMVHIFDFRAGEHPVASCGRHHDWAMCVQVPDGLGARVFETADRAVHSWDLRRLLGDFRQSAADRDQTAKALAERHRHKQLISGMRLDAFRLVSCSLDGCVLLSSLENRELGTQESSCVEQHTDVSVLKRGGTTQWMLGVDFAETKMATSTVDGAVQIYHLLHLHTLPGRFLYT